MIERAIIIEADGTNPDRNMAIEEYLVDTVAPKTCILYLWQNKQTVVIGQNQNAWQECNVQKLREDGGHVARRLSGGGAVFHDSGNLNFTFIMERGDYDVTRQSAVIMRAVSSFGVETELSGRNDILANGRKFSGNAYFKRGNSAYHHGTLLVKVDMQNLSKYLNVAPQKLESNGVKSVVSRVCNLCELSPEITIASLKERLVEGFEQEYGAKAERITTSELDGAEIARLTAKFASDEWKFGKKMEFNCEFSEKFEWGMVTVQLLVKNGVIAQAQIFSDAMDNDFIALLAPRLQNVKFAEPQIRAALEGTGPQAFVEDIIRAIRA